MTTTFDTPLDIDPLPSYNRDPEAVSIISSAPSYHSEAPTYHSRRPSVPESETELPAYTPRTRTSTNDAAARRQPNQNNQPERIGLPALRYAPGFTARPLNGLDVHAYNISAWNSINTAHSNRQVHAVARRRASHAVSSAHSMLNPLSAVPPPAHSTSPTRSRSPTSTVSASAPPSTPRAPQPLLPHEDPDLVGEMAASRARNARLYRERCLRGEERFRHEGRSWDFMLAQMSDWEERQRSWKTFKEPVGKARSLARRIGLRS